MTNRFCRAICKDVAYSMAVNQSPKAGQTFCFSWLHFPSSTRGTVSKLSLLDKNKLEVQTGRTCSLFFNFESFYVQMNAQIPRKVRRESFAQVLLCSPSFLYCVSVEPFLFWMEGLPVALKKFTHQIIGHTGGCKDRQVAPCDDVSGSSDQSFGILLFFMCVFDRCQIIIWGLSLAEVDVLVPEPSQFGPTLGWLGNSRYPNSVYLTLLPLGASASPESREEVK